MLNRAPQPMSVEAFFAGQERPAELFERAGGASGQGA
ncbi:hypothetical protein LKMONMHP_1146 [Methylobacterium organophilum]|uniref:Uncharacterized protein n=1 Tax=Methylobacterium organophilum TaxID=410 RepID=A0ABQ4T3T2_METOR|nr:hypothetical protein LKMONMHP_1146 [Methylobacterium organophilum]